MVPEAVLLQHPEKFCELVNMGDEVMVVLDNQPLDVAQSVLVRKVAHDVQLRSLDINFQEIIRSVQIGGERHCQDA